MTKIWWLVLLVVFELTWLAYLALLLPVAAAKFTHAPDAEVRRLLLRVTAIMPAVLLVSVVTWAFAIYDVVRRAGVAASGLWAIGFLVLGMFVLPIYYATHVHASATISS